MRSRRAHLDPAGDAIEIWNHSQDAEKNSRLIQKVTRSGHNSVVEHACFHLHSKTYPLW